MYERFAVDRGWYVETTDWLEGRQGGFKSIVFSVDGRGAYAQLRFESGIHRVQRFSETAATDVMHTSAAGVVVLPEVEDVEVIIKRSDVRIDTFRAGGAGGQHQNMTDSGVRLTHLPTGTAVEIRDGRSQTRNLERGWKILAARVEDAALEAVEKSTAKQRKTLRGRGSRCEKIRTYNYPQDRVTDHRIGATFHNLPKILDGGLDPLVDSLLAAERTASAPAISS